MLQERRSSSTPGVTMPTSPAHALTVTDAEYAGDDASPKDDSLLIPRRASDSEIEPPTEDSSDSPRTSSSINKKSDVQKPAPPNAGSKILFLDGLRGLAAMMVVVQHVGYMGIPIGQPAVDTFFVLSAFLLTMIFEKKARTLLNEKVSYKRWGWALLDYFARRFLRVYPLFAIVATYLLVYSPPQKEKLFFVHHPENYNLWKVLTFKFEYRYHVFWTLPLEIAYYFLIPVFVMMVLLLKKFWIVPMLPLGYLVAYSGFYWSRGDHMPLKPHLPTFICGSMAAIVYVKADQWITKRQFVFRWYHWLVLRVVEMSSLAILFSVLFGGLVFSWVFENPIPQTSGGHFVSANVSLIIVCEMLLPGVVSSLLEWCLLRYAGKISFSMYLLHSFVIYSDWVRRQGYYNKFFAVWGLTFLLSTVSYHLVEYPSQWVAGRLGQWIKKKDAIERERAAPALPVVTRMSVQTPTTCEYVEMPDLR
ncbi:hypothetical protein Poli38472_003463 [Pythium oligandrum]|uniref:PI-PLC Y-box domain-containing protein n=1 Tax=Pythium oligandrum TaxID=41045 RepID=A0A8K1FG81_PYTOL|nr:hypothetical protein Poli38472_003463 [Pythium oligandrum]|eukprot:TMW57538.1 hypothetical protein Poli38472_003463 [Pythium oligandrum]